MSRLLVIDPAVQEPEHESVVNVTRGFDGDVTVLRPALDAEHRRRLPLMDCDGAVILGSHTSVHDSAPWLTELEQWLQPILSGERRIPVLGICFAHQLIAKMAGSLIDTVREDGEFYADVTESTLEASKLVDQRRQIPVLAIQRWEVKDVPAGYRRIATRPSCIVDGLQHDSLPIFSFQFHLDGREDMARRHGVEVAARGPALADAGDALIVAFHRLL